MSKSHPAAAAVRERTGQPAGLPAGRDVLTDPADRPKASGPCRKCCTVGACIVHGRYSCGTIKSCIRKGGMRAHGVCAPAGRPWVLRGVGVDSLAPGSPAVADLLGVQVAELPIMCQRWNYQKLA